MFGINLLGCAAAGWLAGGSIGAMWGIALWIIGTMVKAWITS